MSGSLCSVMIAVGDKEQVLQEISHTFYRAIYVFIAE